MSPVSHFTWIDHWFPHVPLKRGRIIVVSGHYMSINWPILCVHLWHLHGHYIISDLSITWLLMAISIYIHTYYVCVSELWFIWNGFVNSHINKILCFHICNYSCKRLKQIQFIYDISIFTAVKLSHSLLSLSTMFSVVYLMLYFCFF